MELTYVFDHLPVRRFTRVVHLLSRDNLNIGDRITITLGRSSSLGCSLKFSVDKSWEIFSNYWLTTTKIYRQSQRSVS